MNREVCLGQQKIQFDKNFNAYSWDKDEIIGAMIFM